MLSFDLPKIMTDNNMQQIAGRLHDFDYEGERIEAGWVSAREATLIF